MYIIFKDNYSCKLNLQKWARLPYTIPACRRRLDRWWRRGEAIDQNAPWLPSLRLLSHIHYNTPLHHCPKISWQTDNLRKDQLFCYQSHTEDRILLYKFYSVVSFCLLKSHRWKAIHYSTVLVWASTAHRLWLWQIKRPRPRPVLF